MSEYQYYEFQAIDRPLTEEEVAYVGSLSSRTDPTSTRAVFTYSYSDFRGKPETVLTKYYDAMLYLTNWGSKQLMFRFPKSILDAESLAPYRISDIISTDVTGEYLIVNVNFHEEEGGEWIEGEGWLSSLVRLRDDLLRGDFRFLYLAWLKAAAMMVIPEDEWEDYDVAVDEIYEYEIGRDEREPPVPAGLQNLTGALQTFVDLFEIDEDLIAVAAEVNPSKPEADDLDLEALVTRLPEAERTDFLIRVVRGEPHVGIQLMKRLRALARKEGAEAPTPLPRRTIGDLLAAAREHATRQAEEERRKAEEARIRRLEEMAPAEPHLWEDVIALIEEKKAKPYAQAVALLVDLHALAEHFGHVDHFNARFRDILNKYSNRSALLRRLREVGLVEKA